jgi:glutamate/tyrosine decarboxylase-like PLP-dependent enzyme
MFATLFLLFMNIGPLNAAMANVLPADLRARGFAVYAALRALGRAGLIELVERCCTQARRLAAQLAELPGVDVLNDVVLNQVLFRFETDEQTDAALAAVQASGEVWLSGTTWNGNKAIRVSVSNWQTGDDETDLLVDAFRRAAKLPGMLQAR